MQQRACQTPPHQDEPLKKQTTIWRPVLSRNARARARSHSKAGCGRRHAPMQWPWLCQINTGPVRLVGVETDARVNPDILAGPPSLIDATARVGLVGGRSQ